MQTTLSIALYLFGAVLATTFAIEQESIKGTLFIGPSQDIAQATLCLEGQSSCRGLRKLEEDDEEIAVGSELGESSETGSFTPLNETAGNPEFVCFGKGFSRCMGYFWRRLEDVFDEHRRLEVTGDREMNHVECVKQPWGLSCN